MHGSQIQCHARPTFPQDGAMTCKTCMTHPAWFDGQFQQLLEVWNRHQDLHDTGADLADLFESRRQLDEARLTLAH